MSGARAPPLPVIAMNIAYIFYFYFLSVIPSLTAVFLPYITVYQCFARMIDYSIFSQKTHAMCHFPAAEVSLRKHKAVTALRELYYRTTASSLPYYCTINTVLA